MRRRATSGQPGSGPLGNRFSQWRAMSTRGAIHASPLFAMCRNIRSGAPDPARPTDYAQVKPDRHHLGLVGAFAVQPIEGVDHVLRKIAGAAEPLRWKNCMSFVSKA